MHRGCLPRRQGPPRGWQRLLFLQGPCSRCRIPQCGSLCRVRDDGGGGRCVSGTDAALISRRYHRSQVTLFALYTQFTLYPSFPLFLLRLQRQGRRETGEGRQERRETRAEIGAERDEGKRETGEGRRAKGDKGGGGQERRERRAEREKGGGAHLVQDPATTVANGTSIERL